MTTWEDIKDKTFSIISGQYIVVVFHEIIAHRDTDLAFKEKLKVWPCTIVWMEDISMTVRLSYTLNNSNSFNKFCTYVGNPNCLLSHGMGEIEHATKKTSEHLW